MSKSDDLISRQAAIDALCTPHGILYPIRTIEELPSAQTTLCGYDIEHLELIARILQKEDLPPERIVEALTDIGRIVEIVKDKYEEALRKAVEQCMI